MDEIAILKDYLDNADYVVVGAGAGLSTSAGFVYSGERFEKYFADFGQKYGFADMYSGGFYPYKTKQEFWAYWSRYIYVNRYCPPPLPVYDRLIQLLSGKDYFIITTNVDHCFQRAGVDKNRLFYTQGDYGLFQCSVPCHNQTYDNEGQIRQMMDEQVDMKIPANLIPRCPKCGKPMTTNLRSDDRFVQDDGWYAACARYEDFLQKCKGAKVLFLELGVGGNTPAIIKYPFWRMTYANKHANYACINFGEAMCPDQIADRSVCINADIGEVLGKLGARE